MYVGIMKIPSALLLTSLLLYHHLGEGQSTSGTEEWGELICHKPNSGLFEIKMDTCDITTVGVEGTCSYKFITKKLLKSVCSVLYDDYACLISPKFTGSACCYLDGVKMSCLPKTTPTPISTPSSTNLSITSATVSVGATPTPSSGTKHMGNGSNHVIDIVVGTVTPVAVAVVVVVVVVVLVLVIIALCVKHLRTNGCRRNPNSDDPDRSFKPINDSAEGGEAGGVDNSERDGVNNERKVKAKGGNKPNKRQKNPQLVSRDGPKEQESVRNRFKQSGRMGRRPLKNVQEETEIEKDSECLSTRTFHHSLSIDWTSKSDMQHFLDNYEPPTFNSINLGPSCDTQESTSFPTDQASDDGNSFYVPTLPKSSSLIRKLNNKDLVTTHMSDLKCNDGTQEKPSITSVVQSHMQSLDQDDPEAEALVVQQKVKVGEDTSSAVAHKQRSCFKSGGTDDETRGSVSRKDPLKKHKFPPAHFGTVGVAITCALILATFVCHGRGYTSTIPHPSFAYKYRWLDRGTPWIRALADRLTYPQNLGPAAYCGIFPMTLTTLISLYDQCQHKTADPTLNDQAYNYQWLDRGTWIGAIAYPLIFGSPNLRLAVYCGIILTTMALIIMATTLISLFDQYQPGPICAPSGVRHCVSLAAIKSCRWTGIAPHVNLPAHQIAAVLIVG